MNKVLQLIPTPYRKKATDALCRFIWLALTGRKYHRICAEAHWRHIGVDGRELARGIAVNALTDEGEEWFLKVALSEAQAVPASYYMGLSTTNEATQTDAVTLTGINELAVSNGYARQAIASDATDWTVAVDSGDWQAVSKEVTFTASGGNWSAALSLFLTNVASGTAGKAIATKDLSQSRTVLNGESLKCTIKVKLQ